MFEGLSILKSSVELNYSFIAAFVIGLLLLVIIGRIVLLPVRVIVRLCISAIIGGLLIVVSNYIGGFVDFHLPLNPITAIIAGVLGVPGVALLALIQRFVLG